MCERDSVNMSRCLYVSLSLYVCLSVCVCVCVGGGGWVCVCGGVCGGVCVCVWECGGGGLFDVCVCGECLMCVSVGVGECLMRVCVGVFDVCGRGSVWCVCCEGHFYTPQRFE